MIEKNSITNNEVVGVENVSRRSFLKSALKGAVGVLSLTSTNKSEARDLTKIGNWEMGKDGKSYKVPEDGKIMLKEDANFSIFPETIEVEPKLHFVIVNKKWQTGALYDGDGKKVFTFQVATGARSKENKSGTPIGLHALEIRDVVRKDPWGYKSSEFPINKDGSKGGAPMELAMHLIPLKIEKGKVEFDFEAVRGVAIHVNSHTSNENMILTGVSHGCMRVAVDVGEKLFDLFSQEKRDLTAKALVLVVDDEIPRITSLKKLIKH